MSKEHLGYENTSEAIDAILDIVEDIENARSPESTGGEKIVWTESAKIAMGNSIAAVKTIGNLGTIAKEILDTEGDEAEAEAEKISKRFGGSPEAVEAIKQVAEGFGISYQGIKTLIELRKASKSQE